MDGQVQNLITPELLVQLGFSVVFLIFVWMLWKKLDKKEGDYVELHTYQATGTTRRTTNYTMFYVYQV